MSTDPLTSATDTFDYIVVGAGSAGAALGARLSEDPRATVLLLESGPRSGGLWSRIPLGVARVASRGRIIRGFHTEPEARLNGRRIAWPRGRVVGGSSAVNGMLWVHGVAREYDRWARAGCRGWSHADVAPWLRRVESYAGGAPDLRGRNGPMSVTAYRPIDALPDAFLDAAAALGIAPRVADHNAAAVGGDYAQFTTRNGLRCDARTAYLVPARTRRNLIVRADALVARVLLERGRATGVRASIGGRTLDLKARREVVLCAGTIGSPQILELSGIGRPEVLAAAGVPLVHTLDAVGENLSDHLFTPLVYAVRPGASWNGALASLAGRARFGARWLARRDGPVSTCTVTAQVFAPWTSGGASPDARIQLQQISTVCPGDGRLRLDAREAITLSGYGITPHSRGSVHIRSADPAADPALRSNYLADERDVEACLRSMRMARRIAAARPFVDAIVEPLRPAKDIEDDAALLEHARAHASTAFHPVGTCRMGATPADSVVDPELRVHGIAGLRVADASIMPALASSNTNALAIVIGERAAAYIGRG